MEWCIVLVVAIVGIAAYLGISQGRRLVAVERENERRLEQIGPIAARVGQWLVLFSDPPRVAVHDGPVVPRDSKEPGAGGRGLTATTYTVHPVTAGTTATAEVDGNVTTVDHRDVYVTFVSQGWSHVEKFGPERDLAARQFAAEVNRAAKGLNSD